MERAGLEMATGNWQLAIVGGKDVLRERVWTGYVLAVHPNHLWTFKTTHIWAPPQT